MTQRRILQWVFALIAIVCTAGIYLARAEKPEHVIKVAFLAGVDDEDHVGAMAFKRYVEARANGRIRVDLFPAGQFCGNERECMEGLQSGILEVHMTTIGGLAQLVPGAQAIDLPYALKSDAIARCVLDGPFIEAVQDEIIARNLGLKLMAVGDTGGWRAFGTTDKEVRTPADLTRLKIRTTPSALEQEFVRTLNAFPTPLPFSEVYTALGSGLLDGAKNSLPDMAGQRFYEHVKHVLEDRHSYMAALWWYSDVRWKALPPDLQAVVADGMKELASATRQAAIDRHAPAKAKFEAAGANVRVATAEEQALFAEAAGGVREWFTKKYGPEWLDKLDRAVAGCEAATAQTP